MDGRKADALENVTAKFPLTFSTEPQRPEPTELLPAEVTGSEAINPAMLGFRELFRALEMFGQQKALMLKVQQCKCLFLSKKEGIAIATSELKAFSPSMYPFKILIRIY